MIDLSFSSPDWVALMLLPAILFVLALRYSVNAYRLYDLFKRSSQKPLLPWIKPFLLVLSLVLLAVALMGPEARPHYTEEPHSEKGALKTKGRQNILLVIDASASMMAADTPNGSSRFQIAKEIADDLMEKEELPNAALYALTSTLTKVVPRTFDKVFYRLLLNQMQINEGGDAGTNFSVSLKKLAEEASLVPDPKTVILISDGDDTELEGLSGQEREKKIQEIVSPVKGLNVISVGVGSAKGGTVPGVLYQGKPVVSRLEEDLLKGAGSLYLPYTGRPLSFQIEQQFQTSRLQSGEGKSGLIYDLYFQVPLGLSLLCLILWFTWPGTFSRLALFCFMLPPLYGDVAREIEIYKEAGDYEKVKRLYESLSPENPWEIGAIRFNLAVLNQMQDESLDKIQFTSGSSPYALELYYTALAERENLKALSEKSFEAKRLQLLLALYNYNRAKNEACLFQKQKGYSGCEAPFLVGQGKKAVKEALSKLKQPESLPQDLLAYALKGTELVKLVQENPSYQKAALSLLAPVPADPVLQDALLNLKQGDYEESLAYFKKTLDKPLDISIVKGLENLLLKPQISKWDVEALGLNEAAKPIYEQLSQGLFNEARASLLALWLSLDKESPLNPKEFLELAIKKEHAALSLNDLVRLGKGSSSLIAKGESYSKSYLENFIKTSYEWQVSEFLKRGCEEVPWNLVYPPYVKALNAQDAALAMMPSDLSGASFYQRRVISYLEEALKALDSKRSQSPDSREAHNETIRLFQDLELNDRAASPSVSPKIVEKPW